MPRLASLLAFVLALFCHACLAQSRIRGEWKLTSIKTNGKSEMLSAKEEWRFVGGRLYIEGEPPIRCITNRPNHIDLWVHDAKGARQLVGRGIYQTKNGQLELCFLQNSMSFRLCLVGEETWPRPRRFDVSRSIKGYSKVVLTLKRE